MELKLSETIPTKDDFIKLHQTTGWNAKGLYTYEQLYSAICNSWYSVSIYHHNNLIGFGRIISDGIYQTFICDVMVHPEYQKQGIGTKVVKTLLKKCNEEGIKNTKQHIKELLLTSFVFEMTETFESLRLSKFSA
jgi:GNAT superfamily N-acetyltransferase